MQVIRSFRQIVQSAGKPTRLVDHSFVVISVDIEALKTNTSDIYVGNPGSNVDDFSSSGNEQGWRLSAGDRIPFEDIDIHNIWIDSLVDGEGVQIGCVIAE